MTRRQAREGAFCLIYESGFHPGENPAVILEAAAETRGIDLSAPEAGYIREVFLGVYGRQAELDGIIGRHSQGWRTERISRIARSVMQLCLYEMLYMDSIPVNVSLNEALELIKTFDDEARAFVNGILNAAMKELIPGEKPKDADANAGANADANADEIINEDE